MVIHVETGKWGGYVEGRSENYYFKVLLNFIMPVLCYGFHSKMFIYNKL